MSILPILVLALFPQAAGASPEGLTRVAPEPEAGLELVYLFNEGFLLRSGEDAVLIDAFVDVPHPMYGALDYVARKRLVAQEAPFDSVDLALVSHTHDDHFQSAVACEFLQRASDCRLVTAPDVIAKLGRSCIELTADTERVQPVLPEYGDSTVLELGRIRVEFLRISHGYQNIQNLGHLITIGGVTVLHVGDAELSEVTLMPYGLAERDIDVALIPVWFFAAEESRRIADTHFAARHRIAVHTPLNELEGIAEHLSQVAPDVILLRDNFETLQVAPAQTAAPVSVGSR